MDRSNLKTASAYLNNLLLARGLLRDGEPVEFARPAKGDGTADATMVRIVNLVHDLILRQDRDQEHRDAIAQTLRSQRAESARASLALDRLQSRNEDLARQLAATQAQERSARAAVRAAENSSRALREEMARLKTTVAQVRTACANDVRKRDVQIQRLKGHLTAQQRGNRSGLVGASITITPGVTGMGATCAGGAAKEDGAGPDLDDPEYSLRQETTEFLTQLSQSLSDENDGLIGLVRGTLATLRELQGLPEVAQRLEGSGGDELAEPGSDMLRALPTSYEVLEKEMEHLLEKLRSLLTNPNFVPIEEVETREEELAKLRAGWERMENRWREAIAMMDGWRARMLNGGNTINLEELTGLEKGLGDIDAEKSAVFGGVEDTELTGEDDGLDLTADESRREGGSTTFSAKVDGDACLVDINLHPDQHALKETNGNRSPRKVSFERRPNGTPAQPDENVSEVDQVLTSSTNPETREESVKSKTAESRLPRKILKRPSSPHPHPSERSPKLTIQEKLDAAQAEAEAAGAARGLEAAASSKTEANGGVVRTVGITKRTKITGRPRRRKSTLSPEELEQLILAG